MKESEWLLRDKYGGVQSPEFHNDLRRIEAGEPLAHVIGYVPFLDCTIRLTSKPLIPRPETEWWTERIITAHKAEHRALKILDIFAGSGCVGVALLKHLPECSVDFADIRPDHLKTIRENVEMNSIHPDRATYVESDVFSNIHETYDLIAANPPYLRDSQTLSPALSFEPREALLGGPAGTDYIVRCIRDTPQHLIEGGTLYLEFDPGEEETIEIEAKTAGLEASFHPDQFGLPRLAVLQYKA